MDTRTRPLDIGASVGPVVGNAAALGGPGISASSIRPGSVVVSADAVDLAWARALEILGPGTVTRDQVRAIVLAAFPRPA